MASSTQTSIELRAVGPSTPIDLAPINSKENNDPSEFLPQPSTTVNVVERWNHPKVNIPRTFATFFAFAIMGANDAAYGALIPYIEEDYGLSYVIVSMVFLSPLAGYAGAALLNNMIHVRFGQRGVAFLGPICHVLAYLGICLHPPYPVLVLVFILAGFGNGLEDAAWNAWFGSMANSNEMLGFLHGWYGLGAVLSPLAATSLITQAGWPWYAFYYIMLGGAVIELFTSLWSFWSVNGRVYRESRPRTENIKESRLKESLKSRVTWVISIFLLCYVGAEVALGGWIVTFMRRERAGQPFESGMVATGFWAGITSGRVVLGFLTPKLGEKFAVMLYILGAMVCQLVFWLAPSFHVSAIFVSLQGFFLGPLFPAAIVAATKILPSHLHVSAIGFAAAFGGGGAAILPFAIGALAQARGVSILQPIILAILVVLLLLWTCLPTLSKAPEGSPNEAADKGKQWFNVDFDLVDAGKRTVQKARSSLGKGSGRAETLSSVEPRAGIRTRITERRIAHAERKHIKKEIRQYNMQRPDLMIAVLQGVPEDSTDPPPYGNVRSLHPAYQHNVVSRAG